MFVVLLKLRLKSVNILERGPLSIKPKKEAVSKVIGY
jgi:hypothetical protein